MKATSTFSKALITLIIVSVFLPISCSAESKTDVALRQLKELHNLPTEGPDLENLKAKLLEIHGNELTDPEYVPYSGSDELSQIEEEIK